MKILAIETSCDETAAAIVRDGTTLIHSVIASSSEMYRKWGGIVPEVAAREQLKSMIPVLSDALFPLQQSVYSNLQPFDAISEHIDAIAVTVGPGLIGSLLVGVETAKTIALITGKPIIPVNHVIAHMYANFIRNRTDERLSLSREKENNNTITFPAVSLVVSGGHTELYLLKSPDELTWLGGTIDDAAGEAFDKTARLLGFENRGGRAIEQAASEFSVQRSKFGIKLPRPFLPDQPYNFSFSGLKTAVVREVNSLKKHQQLNNKTIGQLAFEIQESITDVLVKKTLKAAQEFNATSALISGGVAANKRLREKFKLSIQPSNNLTIHAPPAAFCTDNAVTIACCAYYLGTPLNWREVNASPTLSSDSTKDLH